MTWHGDAYVFGNDDWRCHPTVIPYLEEWNYNVQATSSVTWWSGEQLSEACEPATLFFVSTHGTPTGFWDDQNDYYLENWMNDERPGGQIRYVFGTTMIVPHGHIMLDHKIDAINLPSPNGPFPPFNPGQPPITLAYIQACSTGATGQYFESLCYPYKNEYTQALENQAAYSFHIEVLLAKYRACVETFFYVLECGFTVRQAREAQLLEYFGADPDLEPEEFARIDGDANTRLRGVYTGASHFWPVTQWYRDL